MWHERTELHQNHKEQSWYFVTKGLVFTSKEILF